MAGDLTFTAVGEVSVMREDPESIVALVRDKLAESDITFCQVETTISERGTPSEQPCNMRAHPDNLAAFRAIGINAACTAGNHAMDYGRDAMRDTMDLLRAEGMNPFGCGENVAEARAPAIVEHDGARIAFIGYNCNLPEESWAATDRKPGCAGLRVKQVFEPSHIHPGANPGIQCFPDRRDFGPMLDEVRRAKEKADIVAVSLHWGLFMPAHYVVDYQTEVAHALIDAGADMLLGTGPHQLKPIEVYKGKVIFYSLGNFAFDWGRKCGIDLMKMVPQGFAKLAADTGWDLEEEWLDHFVFPSRGRKAAVGKWTIRDRKIVGVSFLPVMINKFAQPRFPSPDEPEFLEVTDYIRELNALAGIDLDLTVSGDEVIIRTSADEAPTAAMARETVPA